MTDSSQDRAVTLLQITDTHLHAAADSRMRGVTTYATFLAVLERAQRDPRWPVDAIIATGDIVQDESRAGYERFRSSLEPLGVPVFTIPGNHDDPKLMAEILNSGPFQLGGELRRGAWSLIMLSTFLAGEDAGGLGQARLAGLRQALAAHANQHVLVCMHHHPLPMGSTWLDGVALRDAAEFWRVIDSHPQVRGVVCGHVHQAADRRRNTCGSSARPRPARSSCPGASSLRSTSGLPACVGSNCAPTAASTPRSHGYATTPDHMAGRGRGPRCRVCRARRSRRVASRRQRRRRGRAARLDARAARLGPSVAGIGRRALRALRAARARARPRRPARDDAAIDLLGAALLPAGTVLRDVLDADVYRLAEQRSAELGIDLGLLQRLEPWLVAVTMLDQGVRRLGFEAERGLEQFVTARAQRDGKEILGLESVETQIAIFDRLDAQQQQAMLEQTLKELDSAADTMDDMARAWRDGRLDTLTDGLLAEFDDFPGLYATLVTDRNGRWVTEIERTSRTAAAIS